MDVKRHLSEETVILNHCFKVRSFILSIVLGIGFCFTFPVSAFAYTSVIVNPDGKLTHLATLGGNSVIAAGINDSGQAVGRALTGHSSTGDQFIHAFITGPNGAGIIDLGTLGGSRSEASGINAVGQVAGNSYTTGNESGSTHAFITGPNGAGMTDLGTLGGSWSIATGINDSGQVVGYSYTTGQQFIHAFITGPNGAGIIDLGTLGGHYSNASGINAAGQVVGVSLTGKIDTFGNEITHAFITGPNGAGMSDLGTLPGDTYSSARGINDSGQAVGYSGPEPGTGFFHAFATGPNGVGMTDLGTLGGLESIANGINERGQVVGYSFTTGSDYSSRHAFVTGPNGVGMADLNSLVALPEGFVLIDATGINNRGQVIAIMVPEPASCALMLAGLGLVGFLAGRKEPSENTVDHC